MIPDYKAMFKSMLADSELIKEIQNKINDFMQETNMDLCAMKEQICDLRMEVTKNRQMPTTLSTENLSEIAFCDRFICKKCSIHLENWVKVVINPDDGDELHYEYEFKFCPECGAEITNR